MMGEISNEADSDCDFVQAITCEVTSLDLSTPAVADLNLAVPRIGSVADDKVVSHPVLHAAFFMIGIKDGGVSSRGAAVVNHDVFPFAHLIACRINLGVDGRQKSELWGGGGQGNGRGKDDFRRRAFGRLKTQEIVRMKGVAFQGVPFANVLD